MEMCYNALDARWRRPRKLKELETLRESAAVTDGGMAQYRQPVSSGSHCGAMPKSTHRSAVTTANEDRWKKQTAELRRYPSDV